MPEKSALEISSGETPSLNALTKRIQRLFRSRFKKAYESKKLLKTIFTDFPASRGRSNLSIRSALPINFVRTFFGRIPSTKIKIFSDDLSDGRSSTILSPVSFREKISFKTTTCLLSNKPLLSDSSEILAESKSSSVIVKKDALGFRAFRVATNFEVLSKIFCRSEP